MLREKWISKEEEDNFPRFENHEEAIQFFEDRYKDDFQFSRTLNIDDDEVYLYLYVVDKEKADEMKEYIINQNSFLINTTKDPEARRFLDSCQHIFIWKNGKIKIAR